VVAAVIAATASLAGCAKPTMPSPASPPASSIAGPVGPSAEAPALGGLLVAAGGALQVVEAGVLAPFDGADARSVEVVAARGVVVVVDDAGRLLRSAPAATGSRTWQPVPMPRGRDPNPRLIGLSPAGTTLALAFGQLQATSFDLAIADLAGGSARTIAVERGLDGPPTWIGDATVAVHAIRDGQRSGFTWIDLGSGAVRDVPSYGVAVAASADGRRVAFDEATSGDVLVGDTRDMDDAGLGRMARVANASGAGVERIAVSGDGTRLAVARRTDTGTTIELLSAVDGGWRAAGDVRIAGDRAVSIAWPE
jgi:hypothetical protein